MVVPSHDETAMRLSKRQFHNTHGSGEVTLTTPLISEQQVEFARASLAGDFAVEQRLGMAFWTFSQSGDAVMFRMRFPKDMRILRK